MPTEIRRRPIITKDGELVALGWLVPWAVSLLLIHAYPAIVNAYVLLGQMS